MADLICAGCRSNVNVPAGYDSPTIRCGICWTELPIGGAAKPASAAKIVLPTKPAVPSKPAVAVAKSVAAVVLPTGTKSADGMAPLDALIHQASLKLSPPNAAPPPVPVVAKVIAIPTPSSAAVNLPVVVAAVAKPLAKKASAIVKQTPEPEVDPDRRQRPTKRRPRDDDEDDDQPRSKRRARQTNNTPMIATIIGGVVVLVAILGGVGYFVFGGSDSKTPTANNPAAFNNQKANNGANPVAFNLPKIEPLGRGNPPAGAPMSALKPLATAPDDGFGVLMPGNVSIMPLHLERLNAVFTAPIFGTGKRFFSISSGQRFEVKYIDAPPNTTPNLLALLGNGREVPEVACTIDTHAGFEYTTMGEISRITQVGQRVFLFRVGLIPAFGNAEAQEALAKQFFDSIRITHK